MGLNRKHIIIIAVVSAVLIVVIAVAIAVPLSKRDVGSNTSSSSASQVAEETLKEYPIIDGHNDLAWQYRQRVHNDVENATFNLRENLTLIFDGLHTDIPRLQKGHVGAQFWACYVLCSSQYKDAVRFSLDQLDVIRRFVSKYDDAFTFVTTAQGIEDAIKANRIASLIGLEGGHSIDSSLGTLRMFYNLGVRYMTITHSCNTPWADNWKCDYDKGDENYSCGPTVWDGLSPWGEKAILEMNRLGMMVDLSHVSKASMEDSLRVSKAPVIFSHTSSYTRCNHYRNVQDDVLRKVKSNKGVVMVNFYSTYINCPPNNQSEATLAQVAEHIDHIKNISGIDSVGIGGDYDGVTLVPKGLEDVSKYPDLFAYLVQRYNWTEEMLAKLSQKNLLRVFREVEAVALSMKDVAPINDEIPSSYLINTTMCRPNF